MAKLTAADRKKIPAKDFAGPDRSYPIPDASHARNALARASGKPVQARVQAAVRSKFPSIEQNRSTKGSPPMAPNELQQGYRRVGGHWRAPV